MLPSPQKSRDDGQKLKDTTPTSVTKTMAAPASKAPEAPTPTMKFSGVLEECFLDAGRASPSRAARHSRALM
jgi:hypothetical protein